MKKMEWYIKEAAKAENKGWTNFANAMFRIALELEANELSRKWYTD